MKSCAEMLRELREDKDLKQIEVANILNTSQQHYSNYETGVHELPLRSLYVLADFYNVSADYILGRTSCKNGVDAINQKINADYTVGAIITDILSLDTAGQSSVIEYIFLQKLKKVWKSKKDSDGVRK